METKKQLVKRLRSELRQYMRIRASAGVWNASEELTETFGYKVGRQLARSITPVYRDDKEIRSARLEHLVFMNQMRLERKRLGI